MHKRSPNDLSQLLTQLLPSESSGEILVGFSGGLDSAVLLHALTYRRSESVRAVHINHGLHPDAARWEAHCAEFARTLRVPYQARTIHVPLDAQEGLESAARYARYAAFSELLRPGETLLTAHHADDQLETVLLALLRGSGVDGLAAMPRCQPFASGWHVRPLLDFTREELQRWASEHGLRWLEDPSNLNPRFDRNYLRSQVVPLLRERWPSAAHAVARTALHLGEASTLLDEVAARDLAAATLGSCLRTHALRSLDGPRRRNVLRYWLRSCGARAPSTRKLAALEHDMLAAEDDRSPCVAWDDVEVRRHRHLLYCVRRMGGDAAMDFEWEWQSPAPLNGVAGQLRAEIAHGRGVSRASLPPRLRVRTRTGGERIRLPGHEHHRELKKLLQEANVLPWWRDRLPLLYVDETLVAVADLWIDRAFAASRDEQGVQFIWDERPELMALTEPTD
jgi:tRNA(Ile)-lysidine synthase